MVVPSDSEDVHEATHVESIKLALSLPVGRLGLTSVEYC